MASPSTNTQICPSSTLKFEYDVFLSFEDSDTGRSFTSHLYQTLKRKGIKSFKGTESESIPRGKNISSEESLKAIEYSRFVVIVFSKNYASSTERLDEVAKIVDCKDLTKRTVFPVFHNVEPSNVRRQIGDFERAFVLHDETFIDNVGKVKKWREALTRVANLSGWDLKNSYETQVINAISKEISDLLVIPTFTSTMNKDLVGIDTRMQKLEVYLDLNSNDVRTIGIWGMAGIGKTTLAKQVYKEKCSQFEACCFLSDIREQASKNGIVHLQRLICKDLLENDANIATVDEGKSVLGKRLRFKKVLIVLDNVDKLKQVEALAGKDDTQIPLVGMGSRIIITTRDKSLLDMYGVNHIYEIENLTDDEALKLFNLKVFKKRPPDDYYYYYKELSKEMVEYAGGLPLVVEVLGSLLHERNVDEWSNALDRLRENLPKEIIYQLQISFQELEYPEKQVFLKIACTHLKGKDRCYVEKELHNSGFNPVYSIPILIDKSLISIDGNNKVQMHNMLQLFGRCTKQEGSNFHNEKNSSKIRDENGNVAALQPKANLANSKMVPALDEGTSYAEVDFVQMDAMFAEIHNLMASNSMVTLKDSNLVQQSPATKEANIKKILEMLNDLSSFETLVEDRQLIVEFQTILDTLLKVNNSFTEEAAIIVSSFLAELGRNVEAYSSAKDRICDAINHASSIEKLKKELKHLWLKYSQMKDESDMMDSDIEGLKELLASKIESKRKLDQEVKKIGSQAETYKQQLTLAITEMTNLEIKKKDAEQEVSERDFAWKMFVKLVKKYLR